MKNTKKLLKDIRYNEYIKSLEVLEGDRIFCKHNLQHFLDVARICYIHSLEKNLKISKDLIYFTALLHDIGRVEQYEKGIDHNQASREIAKKFLEKTTFSQVERELILATISNHSSNCKNSCAEGITLFSEEEKTFIGIFKLSDNQSRSCFTCHAYNKCNWTKDRKNETIEY